MNGNDMTSHGNIKDSDEVDEEQAGFTKYVRYSSSTCLLVGSTSTL